MRHRLTVLFRLAAVSGLLVLAALANAPASHAASTPWGELANFADKSGELNGPEAAFGVNPEDGSVWIVDKVLEGGEEKFRIQKFEQVSSTWKVVASRVFRSTEAATGEVLTAEGVAFDTTSKRAYVLIAEEATKGAGNEEQAADELWAFSTTTGSGKIEPASETKNGVLVERTSEKLTGSPIGKTKFAPQDTEKGTALYTPGGITVNPANHQILITGWDTKENTKEQPAVWAVSAGGTIEHAWEQSTAYPHDEGEFRECGCLNSPVVTPGGKILALGENSNGEIYEIPSGLQSSETAKRAIWFPFSKAECLKLQEEKEKGKNVETCPFVEGLTEINPGSIGVEGGEMAVGREGDVFVHVRVPNIAEHEAKEGAVMLLSETGGKLGEIGWTGGGSNATATQECSVNETTNGSAGPSLVGGFEGHVFMFERGELKAEQTKALELGEGGNAAGCPKGTTTPPAASQNGTEKTTFPLSAKVTFSSKLTQANAVSTEWEFEPGVTETVNVRQQATTSVEHKFAKEGVHKVIEKIHTDDLASPVIETSTEVTITGPPIITGEEAVVEGSSATLKGDVNPNGQKTKCEFQYGPASEPFTGAGIKKEPCNHTPIEGKVAVLEELKVSVEAGKEYHFRIVATSGGVGEEVKTAGEEVKYPPQTGGPGAETTAASEISATGATLNGKVNPKGVETSCKFEYGPTVPYEKSAPCASGPGSGTSPVAVSAKVSSLTAGTTYHFRVVAENSEHKSTNGGDLTFKTAEQTAKPTVETLAATGVTQTGSTLKGSVNPNGAEVTECNFEYGPTTSYGTKAACPVKPGAGHGSIEETLALAGLEAGKTYHFRLVAKNSLGTGETADRELTTHAKEAPSAVTGAASAVARTTATLTGTVNPNDETASCEFEYGTTTAYGSKAPCSPAPGAGTAPVSESAAVSGLAANTVYHYRIVASGTGGTSLGKDAELKTEAESSGGGGGGGGAGGGGNPPIEKHEVLPVTEESPTVTVAGAALSVAANGSLGVKLGCPVKVTQCAGTLTLKTLTAVVSRSAGAAKAKKAILTLATASFTIAGGQQKVVTLHLSAKAKKLLAKMHTVRAKVTIVAHDPTGGTHTTTAVVTLKAKKKH